MDGVTIDVHPAYASLGTGLRIALSTAQPSSRPTLEYGGATFQLTYRENGQIAGLKVVLEGLDTPLPAVFTELKVNHVVLRSSIPSDLKAQTGWYVGENFGLPGAACCIDPQGVNNNGHPQIYANGASFRSVVELFRKVMAGGLIPGYGGDVWSGTVYRR